MTVIGVHPSQWQQRHLTPLVEGLQTRGVTIVPATEADTVIVASRIDAEKATWRRTPPKRLILVEHGAGQQYAHPTRGTIDASFGTPDPNVTLFLAPSQRVADQMRHAVPRAVRVVVGSPAVERLRTARLDRMMAASVAGVAWPWTHVWTCHWQMHSPMNESFTSWPWSLDVLKRMDPDVRVAHGHPRIQHRIVPNVPTGCRTETQWDVAAVDAAVLVADNTSVMWEALTVGIPVVAMTPPGWLDGAPHGFPRFGPDRVRLPTIHNPDDTAVRVAEAIEGGAFDPGVYEIVDGATDLAVSVIMNHVVD